MKLTVYSTSRQLKRRPFMLKRLVKNALPSSAVAAVNHWRMRERLHKLWGKAEAAAPAYQRLQMLMASEISIVLL
ncbi:hypothetical protein AB9F39_38255, partial [Rhizobium leguminosarum]